MTPSRSAMDMLESLFNEWKTLILPDSGHGEAPGWWQDGAIPGCSGAERGERVRVSVGAVRTLRVRAPWPHRRAASKVGFCFLSGVGQSRQAPGLARAGEHVLHAIGALPDEVADMAECGDAAMLGKFAP